MLFNDSRVDTDGFAHRFPNTVHGTAGDELAEAIWEETLKELSFANVDQILDSL